jgi:hypothetical protein
MGMRGFTKSFFMPKYIRNKDRMPKSITNLLESIRGDLKELGLPPEIFTLTSTIYARHENNTHTGNLRVDLVTFLEALETANKRLNKVYKLEKRVELLEEKLNDKSKAGKASKKGRQTKS